MPAAMLDERLVIAIGRLERALARIESLPTRPTGVPGAQDGEIRAEYGFLEERHQRLRESTTAALAGLDRLIGSDDEAGDGAAD